MKDDSKYDDFMNSNPIIIKMISFINRYYHSCYIVNFNFNTYECIIGCFSFSVFICLQMEEIANKIH